MAGRSEHLGEFPTLAALEIVLGVDNLVFISIATSRLPESRQVSAQRTGLLLALGMRIALLASLVWVVALSQPILTLFDFALSWRDLALLAGGGFLLTKGTLEIHQSVEGGGDEQGTKSGASFFSVIGQIVLLDLVFSIDQSDLLSPPSLPPEISAGGWRER